MDIEFFKNIAGIQLHCFSSDAFSPIGFPHPKSELHIGAQFVFASLCTDSPDQAPFKLNGKILRRVKFLVVLYPMPRIMDRVGLRIAIPQVHRNLRVVGNRV